MRQLVRRHGRGAYEVQQRRRGSFPLNQQPDGVCEIRNVNRLHLPASIAQPRRPRQSGERRKQRGALPALADDKRRPDHGPAGKTVLLGELHAAFVRRALRQMERRPRPFACAKRRNLDQLGHPDASASLEQRGRTRDVNLLEAVRAAPTEDAGGIDHRVYILKARAPIGCAVLREIAGDGAGIGEKTPEPVWIAPARDDPVARALKLRRDPAANKAARPGNQNAHRASFERSSAGFRNGPGRRL